MATPPIGAPPAVAPVGAPPDADVLAAQQAAAQLKALQDAAAKAQAQPGGLTQQGYTFNVNPDGTLTITGTSSGKPNPYVGAILGPDGMLRKPDGTPMPQGGVAGNPPQYMPRTPSGAPATANPNFKSNGVTNLVDLGADAITKDNPIAGQIRAGVDLAQGKSPTDDLLNGFTAGAVGVGPDGKVIPGDVATDLGRTAADAGLALPDVSLGGLGGLLSGAPDPSVGGLDAISGTASSQQQELDQLRRQAEANPTAAPQAGLVQLDQTNIDPLRQRQGTALDQLQQAANGTLPSAAEIAAKDAANRASAQAYGNAAALQGGNSSGGTLRQALDAQTQIQGDLQTKLLADRAAEQATARQQLVQGIGAAQSNEGQLATSNANLAQQTGLANQTSAVNTRAQDINREQNLISGATADTSNATAAAKAALDAKVQEQANNNALKGAELGAAAGIIPKVLSDRRSKTDIKRADLVNLADHAPGYTFEYKDPSDGPGKRVSVMAQDVAKSPLGASMVRLGGDGEMSLDGANAVGAALAMSAQALREAEAARKGRGLVRL
jgi:hypothetical protein